MPDVFRQTYPFALPDLPYPYDALAPYVDEATMRVHHDKHHKTYVDKLNEAVAREPDLHRLTLVELLRSVDQLPDTLRLPVRHNGGGHYNHDLFWRSLAPNASRGGRLPRGELAKALADQYGSFESFQEKFTQVAATHFASGWVALVFRPLTREFSIVDLKDHDIPPAGSTAILIVDVWEHAYYLKYQNRRPEFLAAIWNVIDWEGAGERFVRSRDSAGV